MTFFDVQYKEILHKVIYDGHNTIDRTGVGTRKVFGVNMRFDLSVEFPAPTLKKLFFESAKKEMLWIYQDQSNDVSVLRDKYGVNIWNEWEMSDGTIGNAYGYIVKKHNQIDKLINGLINEPHSRRHVISLWDIDELPHMSLQPCAFQTIWSVTGNRLNCQLIQRSGDLGLGIPFNTAQYAILVHMIAHVTGLKPGELWHTITDAHVYSNHTDQLLDMIENRQIMTNVKPQIKIETNTKDFYNIKPEHIVLYGYDSHPHVRLEVAV